MLNMYLCQMPDDTVLYNDGFFDLNVDSIVYDKDILFKIDGVKYAGNQRIYSKFDKKIQIDVSELSTGCKTALNIYSFPDKIFYIGECGVNAKDCILNFRVGNIFVNEFFVPSSFCNRVNVYLNGQSYMVNTDLELLDLFQKVWG